MAKSNPRCVRLTEEVEELINQQVGETFTQKLETLVYNCYWALPEKEKKLKEVNKEIERRQARLRDLMVAYQEYSQLSDSINYSLKSLSSRLERAVKDTA